MYAGWKKKGTTGNWREWMHDWNISCRKKIEQRMEWEQSVKYDELPSDGSGYGRWRLTENCVVYSRPWEEYTHGEIFDEYVGRDYPFKT
jgi:hypothetical protein